MARTHYTVRKSTSRPPVGHLAPWNVPQPQESQPGVPQHISQEEEPFVIEMVVPESPTAQGSPNINIEDKAEGENPPPSDTEVERIY
jgi:hypothetical protein